MVCILLNLYIVLNISQCLLAKFSTTPVFKGNCRGYFRIYVDQYLVSRFLFILHHILYIYTAILPLFCFYFS